jgi:hypothetical protein
MTSHHRLLFVFLVLGFTSIPGFSQKTDPPNDSDGLRKITNGSGRDLDIEGQIDEDLLEANIELAVEDALKSVEVVLNRLDIHIEPIQIDLADLDININPVVINVPDVDIDIDPVEIDLGEMDVDVDEGDLGWSDESDRVDHDVKDDDNDGNVSKSKKSHRKDDDAKDQSNGLKKIDE